MKFSFPHDDMVWDDRVWYPAMVRFTTERYGMVMYGIHIT